MLLFLNRVVDHTNVLASCIKYCEMLLLMLGSLRLPRLLLVSSIVACYLFVSGKLEFMLLEASN